MSKAGRPSRVVVLPVDDRRVVAYHSLLGRPQLVEFDTRTDRDAFVASVGAGPAESGLGELDGILSLTDAEARQEIAHRGRTYIESLPNRVSYLSLLTSEACNLGCSYCIADANMKAAAAQRVVTMPWDIARRTIDWYFSTIQSEVAPYINFSGGEPLLNWRLVVGALDYIKAAYPERLECTRFSINTNATLITLEIARVLKDHKVTVATSLDGTPEASDLVRVSKRGGSGVSSKILTGWNNLAAVGHPVTGFMATFDHRNLHYLNEELVDFAAAQGFKWLRVDCDVIHLLAIPVEETIERIWRVYSRGKKVGIAVEGFWSTAIHNLLSARSISGVEFFCGAVSGETVSVHPDGRVSACGFSREGIGHVSKDALLQPDLHARLTRSYLPGERRFCHGCSIEGSCAGGCNIAREEAVAVGDDAAIEYNCSLYREMTRRLLLDHLAGPSGGIPKVVEHSSLTQ